METNGQSSTPPEPRPSFVRQAFNYLWRATWLKCPVCGTQPMFPKLSRTRSLNDWFTPLDGCPRCGYPYEREPGYFLLAIWAVGYIVASIFAILLYVYLQIWHSDLALWKTLVLVGLPVPIVNVLFARHSKAYWLAIDHLADPYIPPSQTDGSEPDDDDGGGPRRPVGPVSGPAAQPGTPDPAGQPGSGIEREREAGEQHAEEKQAAGVR